MWMRADAAAESENASANYPESSEEKNRDVENNNQKNLNLTGAAHVNVYNIELMAEKVTWRTEWPQATCSIQGY